MSAHVMDSVVYGHLWGTAELRAVFCDAGRTQAWLDILVALAAAQAELGIVPAAAAAEIAAQARVELVDLDEVAERTRRTGHSTLGLIQVLRELLGPSSGEWVYYGATVQDVTDAWTGLVMRQMTAVMVRDLGRIAASLLALAARHRDTIMVGRTHGQPGLPITFGFKVAVWAAEVGRHIDRWRSAAERLAVGQLAGAVGTCSFWGEQGLELQRRFCARLGLGVPDMTWLTARDRVAEFVWLLAASAGTIAKIGREVYNLARLEVGELAEGFRPGQVGSITMPHKRNPELSEHLGTLARVVRSTAGLALEGMVCDHERDGAAWKAEWAFLPEACMAAGAAAALGADLVAGLQVDPARMAANLERQQGYVLSEPVLAYLAPRLGKHTAAEVVYEAAMAGIDQAVGFRDALLADPRVSAVLSEAELDGLLDPAGALGQCGALVDRVLATRAGGRVRLALLPRFLLGALPTPLQPAPRLSAAVGVPVLVKRDDLTGIGVGGNKIRKLEYLVADALAGGADVLVTGGSAQSNHTALTALAARRAGIGAHLVFYGDPSAGPPEGNAVLNALSAADITYTGDEDRASVDPALEDVAATLRAAGRRPYLIPRGGATPLGCVGYVRASLELAGQLAEAGSCPTALVTATGSCGTQAGLVLGARWLQASYRIVGVTVSRPQDECVARIRELASASAALLGLGLDAGLPEVEVLDGYLGPGYGLASAEGQAASELLARTEGLLLDPVFTAKAMAALVDLAPELAPGPVIFLHTGGAPTAFVTAGLDA